MLSVSTKVLRFGAGLLRCVGVNSPVLHRSTLAGLEEAAFPEALTQTTHTAMILPSSGLLFMLFAFPRTLLPNLPGTRAAGYSCTSSLRASFLERLRAALSSTAPAESALAPVAVPYITHWAHTVICQRAGTMPGSPLQPHTQRSLGRILLSKCSSF